MHPRILLQRRILRGNAIEAKKRFRRKAAKIVLAGVAAGGIGAKVGHYRTKRLEREIEIKNEGNIEHGRLEGGLQMELVFKDEKYFQKLTPDYLKDKNELIKEYHRWLVDLLRTNDISFGLKISYDKTTLTTSFSKNIMTNKPLLNIITNRGDAVEAQLNSLQAKAREKVDAYKEMHRLKTDRELVAYLEGRPLPTKNDYLRNIFHDSAFGFSAVVVPILLWIGIKRGYRRMQRTAARYLRFRQKKEITMLAAQEGAGRFGNVGEMSFPQNGTFRNIGNNDAGQGSYSNGNANGLSKRDQKQAQLERHDESLATRRNEREKYFFLLPKQKKGIILFVQELGLHGVEVRELLREIQNEGIEQNNEGMAEIKKRALKILEQRSKRLNMDGEKGKIIRKVGWNKVPVISRDELKRLILKMGFVQEHVHGGHLRYFRSSDKRSVQLIDHGPKDVRLNDLKKLLQNLGMTPEEFLRVLREK
ncbi:MAG: type II toxin-antitoxin system HicA family toxin [Candidatus Diapherotrites archaeon]|nr:type II toxin-antitoxin system HicA family toxin [Candidatus Diapherotrites archaeon]